MQTSRETEARRHDDDEDDDDNEDSGESERAGGCGENSRLA